MKKKYCILRSRRENKTTERTIMKKQPTTWEEFHKQKQEKEMQFGLIISLLAIILAMAMVLFGMSGVVHASDIPEDVAVTCILGEARGEGYIGMLAVAEAMRNRGHIGGVDGCSYNPTDIDPIQTAFKAWHESKHSNVTNESDHWHANYMTPWWAEYGIKTVVVGDHIFYKEVYK